MAQPFFAYILRCADGSYYVGHTDDLAKRVAEHQHGTKCTYTSARRSVALVWSQEFSTREEARETEARIKPWSRAKKDALVRGDWAALRAAARKTNWNTHRDGPLRPGKR